MERKRVEEDLKTVALEKIEFESLFFLQYVILMKKKKKEKELTCKSKVYLRDTVKRRWSEPVDDETLDLSVGIVNQGKLAYEICIIYI